MNKKYFTYVIDATITKTINLKVTTIQLQYFDKSMIVQSKLEVTRERQFFSCHVMTVPSLKKI